MKTLYLFEIYPNGSEDDACEYHDYWADSLEQATAKMRESFPDALVLNQFASI